MVEGYWVAIGVIVGIVCSWPLWAGLESRYEFPFPWGKK